MLVEAIEEPLSKIAEVLGVRDLAVDSPRRHDRGQVLPEQLRFGLSFSDGPKGTTLDPLDDLHDGEKGIRLHQGSGGGGNGEQYANLWVSPIRPEKPVEFVCEWPAFGIEETKRRIDGSHFIKASG